VDGAVTTTTTAKSGGIEVNGRSRISARRLRSQTWFVDPARREDLGDVKALDAARGEALEGH